MTRSMLGAESRVLVPQTMAILVGSTGMNKVAQARGFRQLPPAVCFPTAEEPVPLSCSPLRAPHYALAPAWALGGVEEAFGVGWIKAGG